MIGACPPLFGPSAQKYAWPGVVPVPPEIEDMGSAVFHGAQHALGAKPALVVIGDDDIAHLDLADRLLPDLRQHKRLVIAAIRAGFDHWVKRPQFELGVSPRKQWLLRKPEAICF